MKASVLSSAAESGWKNYEDFADGIDGNRLLSTTHWRGRTLVLALEDQPSLTLAFQPDDEGLNWQWGKERGKARVDEVCMDEGLYFFSFLLSPAGGSAPDSQCLALVINTLTRRGLAVRCCLQPAGTAGGSRLEQQFMSGTLAGGEVSGEAPALTRELIGFRALNIYSPNHYYEHFYVNSQRYAWQNLRGEQFGQGDMDYATYYKFSADRYLFAFREKIIPVCSVFFFDYPNGRCTGIFMGLDSSGDVKLRPAGALISKMSFNCYPNGIAPL
ncbi:MoaF C-terminal domain-containing protein [Erwinia sp. E602]|uniref:MoaF C-terminal domain-containing protein n=1 Tax=Erwinia sp. E602 TaxID=2675378 RepID=UPI002012B6BE|nr:MoaF C-terminal domain-containing protein [Erwinia sp. E602]